MTATHRITPQLLHQVAIALNGEEPGAVENLALILGQNPSIVASWCAGTTQIPDGIFHQILSAMGGTEPADPTWRRDEWMLAHGALTPTGIRRQCLFHLTPPRFRCRVVELYVDTQAPLDTEEPIDISEGLTYPVSDRYELAEFEWFDPLPRPDNLIALLDDAAQAFQGLSARP